MRVTIELPDALHQKWKNYAQENGRTMREVAIAALEDETSDYSEQELPESAAFDGRNTSI